MDKKHFGIFLAGSAAILLLWYLFVMPWQQKMAKRVAERQKEALELRKKQEEEARKQAEQKPEPEKKAPAETNGSTEPGKTPAEATPEKKPAEKKPAEKKSGEQGTQPAPPKAEIKPAVPIRPDLVLNNDLIDSVWTNKGAGLVAVRLLKYHAPYKVNGKRRILELLRPMQPDVHSMVLESITVLPPAGDAPGNTYQLQDVVYRVLADAAGPQEEKRLVFEHALADGLVIRKVVTLTPDAYDFGVKFIFENKGKTPVRLTYTLRTAAGIEPETLPPNQVGAVMGIREKSGFEIVKKPASKFVEKPFVNESAGQGWVGVESRYFIAVAFCEKEFTIDATTCNLLVDEDLAKGKGRWAPGRIRKSLENPNTREQLAKSNVQTTVRSARLPREDEPALQPGQSTSSDYKFIVAPKRDDVLAGYKADLQELQQFAWFRGISRVLLFLLTSLHKFIPNYGVCILILTLVIKALLHPLSKKSQVSMVRMQQLQPELLKLKERFGDDKKRLGTEQWALYHRYGVNPMSGCLPMLIQMPVFLALFGALRASIHLRQASFLWIGDLSQPDTVYHLPFDLPLLHTDAINVLPFVFLVSSVVSQMLQPKALDEKTRQQQTMMKWMSFFFAFILYNMPSGLLLYWTASNILGILEQWQIRRHVARIKIQPIQPKEPKKGAAAKPSKPGKSGGLLDSLNRMLEEQQTKSSRGNASSGKKDRPKKGKKG